MRSRRYAISMAAVGLLIGGAVGPLAPAAFADHTREHTCDQLDGIDTEATFTVGVAATGELALGRDRCVVVTTTAITGPYGKPANTLSDPKPVNSPFTTETAVEPTGETTTRTEARNVGSPVVVESKRPGAPVVTSEDIDNGEPTAVPVVVAGAPQTATRTESGTPTSTEAPGTRNCERVNNEKAAKGVERCERTVVTTTTTPTTEITTVTTPQERVTTTTQPRQTVTTTTTPVTEVSTSTQQQESCRITTQPTSSTRTTTQLTTQSKIVTYQQKTITTTTTTTYRYEGGRVTAPMTLVKFENAPNPRVTNQSTPVEPLSEVVGLEAGPQEVTMETLAGPDIVTTECAGINPEVTITDGETTDDVQEITTPADPAVTVTREDLAPIVDETMTLGQPIVTTSTRGTGETCTNNPSNSAQRANRC